VEKGLSDAGERGVVAEAETYIILLFPMFFTSAWCSPYQINDVNLAKFNIRTRSLNNTLGGLSTIPGALLFGYALDQIRFRRRVRAKTCHVVPFCLVMAVLDRKREKFHSHERLTRE
jgi:hypothetical protein